MPSQCNCSGNWQARWPPSSLRKALPRQRSGFDPVLPGALELDPELLPEPALYEPGRPPGEGVGAAHGVYAICAWGEDLVPVLVADHLELPAHPRELDVDGVDPGRGSILGHGAEAPAIPAGGDVVLAVVGRRLSGPGVHQLPVHRPPLAGHVQPNPVLVSGRARAPVEGLACLHQRLPVAVAACVRQCRHGEDRRLTPVDDPGRALAGIARVGALHGDVLRRVRHARVKHALVIAIEPDLEVLEAVRAQCDGVAVDAIALLLHRLWLRPLRH
mmetsp:Transcript_40264/g.125482  ORF Transcript_40264/g.125482 Transcript_40264/m.125482 type:complete len:273 (-) Transcript_40264:242-1060(-)